MTLCREITHKPGSVKVSSLEVMSQRTPLLVGVAVGFGLASLLLFSSTVSSPGEPDASLRGGDVLKAQLAVLQSEVAQSKLLIASLQSQLGGGGGPKPPCICEPGTVDVSLQARLDSATREIVSLRHQLATAGTTVVAQCSPNPTPAESVSATACVGPPPRSSDLRMHLFGGSYDEFLDILTAPGFLADWMKPPFNGVLDVSLPNGRPLNFALSHHLLIPGIIVEGGVYVGTTIRWMASRFPDRKLFGFDSFEGLPEKWRTGFEGGEFNMSADGLPSVPSNVELVKGWFENTMPQWAAAHAGETIAVLHVDCDIYSATVTMLKYMGPMLRPGSIIVFDDLFNYPEYAEHEAKAMFEYFSQSTWNVQPLGKHGPALRTVSQQEETTAIMQSAAFVLW